MCIYMLPQDIFKYKNIHWSIRSSASDLAISLILTSIFLLILWKNGEKYNVASVNEANIPLRNLLTIWFNLYL